MDEIKTMKKMFYSTVLMDISRGIEEGISNDVPYNRLRILNGLNVTPEERKVLEGFSDDFYTGMKRVSGEYEKFREDIREKIPPIAIFDTAIGGLVGAGIAKCFTSDYNSVFYSALAGSALANLIDAKFELTFSYLRGETRKEREDRLIGIFDSDKLATSTIDDLLKTPWREGRIHKIEDF